MQSIRVCSWFVRGRDVRPRRAREAFWRWEQAFARWTRDIVGDGRMGDGFESGGRYGPQALMEGQVSRGSCDFSI